MLIPSPQQQGTYQNIRLVHASRKEYKNTYLLKARECCLCIYLGGRQHYSRDRRSKLEGFRPSLSHPSRRSNLRSSPS